MRMSDLRARGQLTSTEEDLIYESAFLASCGQFEAILKVLLQEFVCGVPSSTPQALHALVRPRSRQAFDVVLRQGRPFAECLPYDKLADLAKLYLRDGRPFTDIGVVMPAERQLLSEAVLVRNAIAHRSDYAMRQFRTKVPGVDRLPPNRQFPGPHLKKVFRIQPEQQYIEAYFGCFEAMAGTLYRAW